MSEAAGVVTGIATGGEIFAHSRIIVGMVLGISVSRLIIGLMRFVQHPSREHLYLPHFGWVLFLLLSIIQFWWFEFALAHRQHWSFAIYFFLIFYAAMFVALSTVLFPDRMDEYNGLSDYFQKRRRAVYGLLLILFSVDVIDTLIKGHAYYSAHYGVYYPIHQAILIAGALLAMFWKSRRYQTAFPIFALFFQIIWIASLFDVMQ